MIMRIFLLLLLLALVCGALPIWPHSRSWGIYPAAGMGVVFLVLLVLVIMGLV